MRYNLRMFIAVALLILAAMDLHAVTPQSTAFTYQGQLNAGGSLPSGQTYQFTFTLYDSAAGSGTVGAAIHQALLIGSGGLFTTDLDFGQIFNGQQYWLEIKVGSTVGTEEALSARQPINAAPVAQYALNSAPHDYADFYASMPPDNAATVAVGAAVSFPQDGPSSGTIVRQSASGFVLPAIGTYQVMFQVSVNEPGQLVIALDSGFGFIELANTVVGRATGTSQLVGIALVNTTVPNTVLAVRNPSGNSIALTITPLAGGTSPVSAHLVITRLN